ncbi:hypothetical protein DFH27DRAFT_372461 [Peziza echinospora]|nr:hypothetical protein DFH27DRAFT_372461 [Peziza echinospora]
MGRGRKKSFSLSRNLGAVLCVVLLPRYFLPFGIGRSGPKVVGRSLVAGKLGSRSREYGDVFGGSRVARIVRPEEIPYAMGWGELEWHCIGWQPMLGGLLGRSETRRASTLLIDAKWPGSTISPSPLPYGMGLCPIWPHLSNSQRGSHRHPPNPGPISNGRT